MAIDYSDVDELRKLSCEACLPDEENKLLLWNKYVNKEDLNNQKLNSSAGYFYNFSDKEQCMKYASKFFDVMYDVKEKQHRDYARDFSYCLSPAFLGEREHLQKFQDIQKQVIEKRPDDTQFLILLSNDIEKMEEILKVKDAWK